MTETSDANRQQRAATGLYKAATACATSAPPIHSMFVQLGDNYTEQTLMNWYSNLRRKWAEGADGDLYSNLIHSFFVFIPLMNGLAHYFILS